MRLREIGIDRKRRSVGGASRRELARFDEDVAEIDARDRIAGMAPHRLLISRARGRAVAALIGQGSELVERIELPRIAAQDLEICLLRRRVLAGRGKPARLGQEHCDLGWPAHGRIAKTRAGKPVPFLISGQVTETSAPVAGTLSRLARSSI